MKLLCDVCQNAVASLICCADEAALCLSCDSRIHAANKLAGKHQRMPLLSEPSEPALCDICQDRPSFFFCIEDRALLCEECDGSIHSVNALAAKHRRFLLTGIQVGTASVASSTSPDQPTSTISLEQQYIPGMSPSDGAPVMSMKTPANMQAVTKATVTSQGTQSKGPCESAEPSNRATKRPCKQVVTRSPRVTCGKESINVGLTFKVGTGSEDTFSSEKASASGAATPKTLRSYMMNKQGTLSIPSNTDSRKVNTTSSSSNSTTISIQRISAGKVPFVAPVLSSLRAALKQENVSNSMISAFRQEEASIQSTYVYSTKGDMSNNLDSDNIESNVTMDVDDCPPVSSDNVSDYLAPGVSEWRLDELLTELIGVYDSGPSLSPPKEGNAPGSEIHEDPAWYAELDFMAEHDNLSPSQEEGVALVPEMPSPPTSSGMVTSRGKPTCPAAQPWEFDYLLADNAHEYSSEFSVVPDIDGGRRSSPTATVLTGRGSTRKKRKVRMDV